MRTITMLLLIGLIGVAPAQAQQYRERSANRTWAGVILMVLGVGVAFGLESCVLDGPSEESGYVEARDRDVTITVDYTPETRNDSCDMRIDARSESRFYPFMQTYYYNDLSADSKSAFETSPKTEWPKAQMYGGLGMVAFGALLATVWADIPVQVSFDAVRGGRIRVSKTIGF